MKYRIFSKCCECNFGAQLVLSVVKDFG